MKALLVILTLTLVDGKPAAIHAQQTIPMPTMEACENAYGGLVDSILGWHEFYKVGDPPEDLTNLARISCEEIG